VQTYCRRQVCWRLERTGEQEGKKKEKGGFGWRVK